MRMNARAAIRAVALSLLSLLGLFGLQGCSMVTLGYGHLDTFTLYLVRDYIQPEPGVQYNEARSAVQRLHQWHRQRELPAYATLATEAAQRTIDAAVQLHGGLGVTKGVKVEELYREIRALRIYEGATEVQKVVIARQTLAAAAGR